MASPAADIRISRQAWCLKLGALALAMLAAPVAANAQDATRMMGGWDLSVPDSNRRCHIVLRSDPRGEERTIGIPAGCRRALPILAAVDNWTAHDSGAVGLSDPAGATVLQFAPSGGNLLSARGPEGETYELIAAPSPEQEGYVASSGAQRYENNARPRVAPGLAQADVPPASGGGFRPARPSATPFQAPRPAPRTAPAVAPTAPAATNAVASGPVRIPELAGRYVILREMTKDTGCMLTLDDRTRGPRGTYRAILAPACRDQGIVIFDPTGWQIDRANRLALTARKGHLAHFERTADGTWQKDPKEGGKPLGFRKM